MKCPWGHWRSGGIKYEQISKVTNLSDDDWKKFIRPQGKVTKTGQLLLEKETESYVNFVLGAQTRTHWTIVGAGARARSLQTQEILTKLCKIPLPKMTIAFWCLT